MNILLVEDDPTLHNNVSEALEAENIRVSGVFDGLLAERLLKKEQYDCVILDINLPGKNGFNICKDFRTFNSDTPVLMLTAFGELEDKVQGFDCGADDYLTKPFYMRELILRVQALIKRNKLNSNKQSINQTINVSDIQINLKTKQVYRKEKEIILTPREFQIIRRLAESPGEIVSKKELIREIWGHSFDSSTNTIEVYINFLRNKIDKPFDKQNIKTKIGFGYYLDES